MLALVAMSFGYVCVTSSAGYALRVGDSARAHALSPGDGRITGLYAQALSGIDATAADRSRADRLARLALRQDPTAVAAVATLGLDTQIRGDVAGSRRLFAYAERLSRRDLRTQVWAIEDAVGRGDVAGALQHYDIALRTSREASDLLFPVLGSAIVEPAVRAALATTLARRPAWAPQFIGYAANQGPALQAAMHLFNDLRRRSAPVFPEADVALVDRLIGSTHLEDAWSYYASFRSGADRRRSRDPDFGAAASPGSLFDWRTIDTPGLSVSFQRGEHGGVADFAATPGTGGTLLQQMQALPAGTYRLSGHTIGIDQPPGSLPYWSLACRDGRELGRVVVPPSRRSNGAFAGTLIVPSDCPWQVLALVIRPSDAIDGIAGQIDRAGLAPSDR